MYQYQEVTGRTSPPLPPVHRRHCHQFTSSPPPLSPIHPFTAASPQVHRRQSTSSPPPVHQFTAASPPVHLSPLSDQRRVAITVRPRPSLPPSPPSPAPPSVRPTNIHGRPAPTRQPVTSSVTSHQPTAAAHWLTHSCEVTPSRG